MEKLKIDRLAICEAEGEGKKKMRKIGFLFYPYPEL
jgi:hypothetical protein